MDPSEYEGTVLKSNSAISAGVFEGLFSSKPKFMKMDLNKEASEIYLQIFSVKESISKWSELSLESLKEELDAQAFKITELKEEYIARRKSLASKVKAFNLAYLEEGTDPPTSESYLKEWKEHSRLLVTDFKSNFDYLTTVARFSEMAFMATYKLLREISDPKVIIEESLAVCVKAQEVIKNAQEQLVNADAIINEAGLSSSASVTSTLISGVQGSGGGGGGSSGNGSLGSNATGNIESMRELTDQIQWLQEANNELKSELTNIKTKHSQDTRIREIAMRSEFERHQYEQQQEWESRLGEKEGEAAALLASLNDLSQLCMEAQEREGMLQSETSKRRDLEERLRTALTELADSRTTSQELQVKYDAALASIQASEVASERETKRVADSISRLTEEANTLRQRLHMVEADLCSRPPADLTNIAQRIGYVRPDRDEQKGENDDDGFFPLSSSSVGDDVAQTWNKSKDFTVDVDGKDDDDETSTRQHEVWQRRPLAWATIESFIIEQIRKSQSEAAECRVREQERDLTLKSLQQESEVLRTKLESKTSEVVALERDLLSAHRAVESGKAILKCFQAKGQKGSVEQEGMSHLPAGGYSPGKHLRHTVEGMVDVDINDLEKGSGGQGAAVAMLGGLDAGDRMIQAVQSQRDRYMKTAQEAEGEVSLLKLKLARAQEEQQHLRAENLELYRRLRVLRAAAATQPGGSLTSGGGYGHGHGVRGTGVVAGTGVRCGGGHDDGDDLGGGTFRKSRSRGNKDKHDSLLGGITDDDDALESKYMQLYEQKIDPFQLEELDRQVVLSRMNVFERGLAYIIRTLMQDSWTRRAVMVYLLLVHCMALGYVIRVLNPQLIEEVDSHLQGKWSMQTMNMNEHPDVRFR